MTGLIAPNSTVVQLKRRRKFSAEEKAAIVSELDAVGATVTGVAKKYGLTTGQVFSWRKKFSDPGRVAAQNSDSAGTGTSTADSYRSMLAAISEQEALSTLTTERLAKEVRSGKGAPYNVSCAINNLATATIKLQERKSFLLERIAELECAEETDTLEQVDLVIEREAEALCLEMVKRSLDLKKLEAERTKSENRFGNENIGWAI